MSFSLRIRGRTLLAAPFLALLILVPSLAMPRTGAHADIFFCEDDPVISFNGVPVSISAGISRNGVHKIIGVVPILVVVPDNVTAAVVSVTNTYFTESVVIIHVSEARAESALSPDHSEAAVLANQSEIMVLSRFITNGTYRTELSANATTNVVQGSSNQFMTLRFPAPSGSSNTASESAGSAP